MPDIANDTRLDPRVKWALRNVPVTQLGDVDSRERLVEISNSPKANALRDKTEALYDALDTEEVASSAGLAITVHDVTSDPDGNTVKIRFVRPEGNDELPCVYYIHGGGMQNGSCFGAMYRIWARVLAAQGVAVAMVDFRNCLTPSSAPEVEPFPAGLNDCVSGLKWVIANASELGIDTVTGGRGRRIRRREPDVGNRDAAAPRRRGRTDQRAVRTLPLHRRANGRRSGFRRRSRTRGSCSTCTTTAGRCRTGSNTSRPPIRWRGRRSRPRPTSPVCPARSSASTKPTRCAMKESTSIDCCSRLAVPAQCRVVMGTSHGMDVFTAVLPDISRETAASIARFAAG